MALDEDYNGFSPTSSIHLIGGHTAELFPLEREAPLARDDSPIVLPCAFLRTLLRIGSDGQRKSKQ